MQKPKVSQLTMLGFYALTVVMVMDLHEYTVFATSGLSLVFFLLAGGVLWFIPVALCSAEMATTEGWEQGGIFLWVEKMLGRRFGFAAVFFQWFQVTVGFVAMLYFIVGALASSLGITFLQESPQTKLGAILVIFWSLTLLQLGGVKRAELIGRISLVAGIMIPGIALIALFVFYLASGKPLQFEVSPQAFFPDFTKPDTLVVFVAFILSYAGIEASASYANELKDPKREYPRVILLVVATAIGLNAIGGLAIAAVVPPSQLSLSGGIFQALQAMFGQLVPGLEWLAAVITLLIAVGVLGEITGWILGPAREMYAAAHQGLLPSVFKKVNAHNIPTHIVFTQGIIVTLWATVLTLGGGGDNLSFLAAITLTTVIYLFAYVLLFIAYIVMTVKHTGLSHAYQIRGGRLVKFLVAGCGLLTSFFAIGISFIPPASIAQQNTGNYEVIVISGIIIVAVLPFVIYSLRKKHAPEAIKGGHHKPRHFLASEVRWFIHPRARGEHHIEVHDSSKQE